MRPRWSFVSIRLREIRADDEASVATYVDLVEACRLADCPWWPRLTLFRQTMFMRHGWDGELSRYFLVAAEDEDAPVGFAALHSSDYDNLDQAWLEMGIHPSYRRRGYGTAAMLRSRELVREMSRHKIGWFGWDGDRTRGFAESIGSAPKSVAVCRRQLLHELEPGLVQRLYDEAEPQAKDYDLQRVAGPIPDTLLTSFVEATAAINDAPLDDLEMDDELFTPERTRAFEAAQAAHGHRIYRVLALHRASGEVAGLTAVKVDGEIPAQGSQLDTSVVRAHRGHRLGLLLKADMLRWLADAEPQLEMLDTFNAESNDHMIGVNERLGYRVMDRELQFQDRI
jgi:RimJ/RimL family protein N-acetyltransferase